jgi:hypothetical protein
MISTTATIIARLDYNQQDSLMDSYVRQSDGLTKIRWNTGDMAGTSSSCMRQNTTLSVPRRTSNTRTGLEKFGDDCCGMRHCTQMSGLTGCTAQLSNEPSDTKGPKPGNFYFWLLGLPFSPKCGVLLLLGCTDP